jgi:hypothetical protein
MATLTPEIKRTLRIWKPCAFQLKDELRPCLEWYALTPPLSFVFQKLLHLVQLLHMSLFQSATLTFGLLTSFEASPDSKRFPTAFAQKPDRIAAKFTLSKRSLYAVAN